MFLIKWGEINGRIDANYYKKEYIQLEQKILKVSKYKLRDFIEVMAGGATPKTTESEKYYSDKNSGIPFLRVQNLAQEGLNTVDCKYIKQQTHDNMLARSKVFENDLLVKITGVGRMAISSVAPQDFEGNINQHMVAIKTKSREISEILATYLNTDIGEKLASRRSTGGTRPALDYTALRSIPIVINEEIVDIMNNAYAKKAKKQKEAKDLLESINDYLLKELGIKMPEKEASTLENRKFIVSSENVIGGRFDPVLHSRKFDFYKNPNSRYQFCSFSTIIKSIETGLPIRKDYRENDGKHPYYGANGIIGYMNEYTNDGKYLVIGQDGYIGNHYIVEGKFWASNHNWVIKINEEKSNYSYIKEFLDFWDYKYLVTGGVIPKITQSAVKNVSIILPPLEKQKEIAQNAMNVRIKAKELEEQAEKVVSNAKKQVEKILLEGSL